MRVMVIAKATEDSENGVPPSAEAWAAMDKFTEELAAAGVLVAGAGLKPSAAAKRVVYEGTERVVTDGPFAETKEQLLGFYIVDCASLDEALDIARELGSANPGGSYEIRPIAIFRGSGAA